MKNILISISSSWVQGGVIIYGRGGSANRGDINFSARKLRGDKISVRAFQRGAHFECARFSDLHPPVINNVTSLKCQDCTLITIMGIYGLSLQFSTGHILIRACLQEITKQKRFGTSVQLANTSWSSVLAWHNIIRC